MTVLVGVLATIGGVVVGNMAVSLIYLMFFNRDGKSGRYKHWTEE